MKRTWKALIVLAAFAGSTSAANAASVVLSSDKAVYLPGEQIILTTTVTASVGEVDNSLIGAVVYEESRVSPVSGSTSQSPYPGFIAGGLACTTVSCRMFLQLFVNPLPGTGTPFVIGTMSFTTGATPGPTSFTWLTTGTQRLDFYGVTNAPGVTITIVPEPTTAALLSLGLFGLALASRRRA